MQDVRLAVRSFIRRPGSSIAVIGTLGFDYPLQTDVFRAVTDYNVPHVRRYSAVARMSRA